MPDLDTGLRNVYIMYGSSIPNYFNRRILFYGSLSDYLTAAGQNYELHEEVNFNPADGVNTYLDVVTDDGDKFSYLLLVDPEDNTIISRWFILEADRNLGGQYRFTLKRDVVAESISNYDFINKAPIYVEKGKIKDESDPFNVLPEGISFNQIKQSERKVSQIQFGRHSQYNLNWGWIVGYFESGATVNDASVPTGQAAPSEFETASTIATATGISLTKINDLLDGVTIPFCVSEINLTYGVMHDNIIETQNPLKMQINLDNDLRGYETFWEFAFSWNENLGETADPYWELGANGVRGGEYLLTQSVSDIKNALSDVIDNDVPGEVFYSNDELNPLLAYEGKLILISGQYYVMHFPDQSVTDHSEVQIAYGENTLFNNMIGEIVPVPLNTGIVYLNYKIKNIGITLEPYDVGTATIKTKISSSAHTLKDAPYNMFAIPFGDNVCFAVDPNNPDTLTSLDKWTALKLGTKIATELGAKLYDLQLLPYIPYTRFMTLNYQQIPGVPIPQPYIDLQAEAFVYDEDSQSYLSTGYESIYFDYIKDPNNDEIGAIFYMEESNFEFNIEYKQFSNLKLKAKDKAKIEANCNFYRLVSPNYSGIYEFNLAKNGMSVEGFNVACTYKPINPFIRVQPLYKGLYGTTFLDGRGLICEGDFSLPIITDAWITYEQNNKNFANIFAREIQNLDVTQRQERINEAISLGSGIVGGGAGGAAAGAKFGGVYGAIAGAAAGTALGATGAIIESKLGQERRAEAKDYMIDRFNMNMQTIKALPQSLAKNSAFTLINKIQPFIEYYTCTDAEKAYFQRKLDVDGQTIGRVDFIGNYSSPGFEGKYYFKGQLIRAIGINEDTHYINALYEELAKGVYI